jgi:hypothetical protein
MSEAKIAVADSHFRARITKSSQRAVQHEEIALGFLEVLEPGSSAA